MFKLVQKFARFVAFGLVGLCFLSTVGIAQQTLSFIDRDELYETAFNYYKLGNYNLAKSTFQQYISLTSKDGLNHPQKFITDAHFYSALCSKALDNESAVSDLTTFIARFGEDRWYHSQANFALGELFFERKKYPSAISCFESLRVEDLDQKDLVHYNFKLAYSYFVRKRFDEAYTLFKRVVHNQKYYFTEANYYLGYLDFENGRYDSALEHLYAIDESKRYQKVVPYYITQVFYKTSQLDRLTTYAPPKLSIQGLKYKPEINKLIGQAYYEQKKFSEALPYLKYYVDSSPKVAKEDLYILAYTQYRFGQYEEAIPNFLELNTLEDELGQNAIYHLADCYLKTGQKEKARFAFGDASKLDFKPGIRRDAHFSYARLCYEQSLYNDAILSFKSFIDTYPNGSDTEKSKTYLSELLEKAGNYKEAISIIESISIRSAGLDRTYQKLAYNRAAELLSGGEAKDAIIYFDKSLSKPLNKEIEALAHFWKANIYFDGKENDLALASIRKYLNLSSSARPTPTVNKGIARYNIGYSFFKEENYEQAAGEFSEARNFFSSNQNLINQAESSAKIAQDNLLRLADCFYMMADYKRAEGVYDEVISNKTFGRDYALYQNGMIAGLKGQGQNKISTLDRLVKEHPDSYYADDALYQKGTTHLLENATRSAIGTFNQLVNDYPESNYRTKALVEIGLAHYNLNEFEQAKTYYDRVIQSSPNSIEAREALANIKDVYISLQDSEGYFNYIDQSPTTKISTSGQDTIRFQFAENYYEQDNCTKAIREFNEYLIKHPNGAFKLYAHFYKGDCLYREAEANKNNEQFRQAKADFERVLIDKNHLFYESALLKVARISYYVEKDYRAALNGYQEVLQLASKPEMAHEALYGLTQSSYHLKDYNSLNRYGNQLLKNPHLTKDEQIETTFYLARMHRRQGNLSEANRLFEQVASATNNAYGAEARYHIAESLYDKGDLENARKACFRIDKEAGSHEYWRAKGFVLLAEIYRLKGELYQAKETLKSVIANYKGDKNDVIADARLKLSLIEDEERAKSKLAEEQPVESDTLKLDYDN